MTGQPATQAKGSWVLQSSLVLGALPPAAGCARLHARNVMCEWSLAAVAESVELVVSELVTNALRASTDADGRPSYDDATGLPRVHLRLSSNRQRVLIEVWDQDNQLPAPKGAGPDDESGRGLMLVEALCERWGCDTSPEWAGKVVWADLRAV